MIGLLGVDKCIVSIYWPKNLHNINCDGVENLNWFIFFPKWQESKAVQLKEPFAVVCGEPRWQWYQDGVPCQSHCPPDTCAVVHSKMHILWWPLPCLPVFRMYWLCHTTNWCIHLKQITLQLCPYRLLESLRSYRHLRMVSVMLQKYGICGRLPRKTKSQVAWRSFCYWQGKNLQVMWSWGSQSVHTCQQKSPSFYTTPPLQGSFHSLQF